MNEFFTYAIYNESRGKIYIGHTENLESRLKRHNHELPNKLKSYTNKNDGFWRLVHKESFSTRKEAMKREKELKSSRGRNFIRQLINNQKQDEI